MSPKSPLIRARSSRRVARKPATKDTAPASQSGPGAVKPITADSLYQTLVEFHRG